MGVFLVFLPCCVLQAWPSSFQFSRLYFPSPSWSAQITDACHCTRLLSCGLRASHSDHQGCVMSILTFLTISPAPKSVLSELCQIPGSSTIRDHPRHISESEKLSRWVGLPGRSTCLHLTLTPDTKQFLPPQ